MKALWAKIQNEVKQNPRWYVPGLAGLVGLIILLIGVTIALKAKDSGSALSQAISGFGSAIAGGALVAFVVLLVEQWSGEEAEKRALLLQVGLWKEVGGLDLRGRDLKGAYWRDVDLSRAHLAKAELDGATLWECKFNPSCPLS